MARQLRIPKAEGEISEMAKETPMASSRELEVQFRADQGSYWSNDWRYSS
jgi:hypothetical protein